MKMTTTKRRGSALVFGLIIVVMVSGMVAGYLMTSIARSRNVADAGEHQEALYFAQAGISKARWLLATEDADMPQAPGESYSFNESIGDGAYYVTVTRKTDSQGNTETDLENEDPDGDPAPDPEDNSDEVILATDWEITDGRVVPDQDALAEIKVLGAQISYNGKYPIMVTFKYRVGSSWEDPNSFDSPVTGNLNDNQIHTFNTAVPAGEGLSIQGRSWTWDDYYGSTMSDDFWQDTDNNDWSTHLSKDSDDNGGHVLVLRDGDSTPPYNPLFGQDEISDLIADYIDSDGIVHLDDNQAIYLFELGQSQASDSSSDFQDLVVLVTLTADPDGDASGSDDGNSDAQGTWTFTIPENKYSYLDNRSSGDFDLTQSGGLAIDGARLTITHPDWTTTVVERDAADFDANTDSYMDVSFGAVDFSASEIHTAIIEVWGAGVDADDGSFQARWESQSLPEPIETLDDGDEDDTGGSSDTDSDSSSSVEGLYEIVSTGVINDARETLTGVVDVTAGSWDGDIPQDGVIIAQQDLHLSGVTLSGDGGGAHTNMNGYIDGTVNVASEVNASLEMFISGTVLVQGAEQDSPSYAEAHSNQDLQTIPQAIAANYLDSADYILVSEGEHEGKIQVVSTGQHVEPETLGWRYGSAINGGDDNPGGSDDNVINDNTTVLGGFEGGILVNGTLDVSGSLQGAVPHVHANGDVTVSGGNNMIIEGELTSAGTITKNGNPNVEGQVMTDAYADSHSGVEQIDVPVYTAADFLAHADYELISTGSNAGKIRNLSTQALITQVSAMGWRFKNGKWILKYENTFQPGFYYCSGNVKLNASGTMQVSIAAGGDVEVGSNMALSPYAESLGILADGDIDMSSNSSNTGIYYAGGKVDMNGTGSILGHIVALGDGSRLGGNFSVTANGDLDLPDNDATGAEIIIVADDTEEDHGDLTGVWELYDEATAQEGNYYGDCRAIISAPVGSAGNPFSITIALTGSLDITGNATLAAMNGRLLICVEGDLVTTTSPTTSLNGIVLAGEQFDVTGTMSLVGLLMSAGQSDTATFATTNSVSGTHTCERGSDLSLPGSEEEPELGAELKQLRHATAAEEAENLEAFELE